jgi:hypothetical protein
MGIVLQYRNYGRLLRVYGRSLIKYGSPQKVVDGNGVSSPHKRCAILSLYSFLEPLYYCGTCSFYKRHHGGPNQDKSQSLGRPSKDDALVSLSVNATK